jgi:hypothetical protein
MEEIKQFMEVRLRRGVGCGGNHAAYYYGGGSYLTQAAHSPHLRPPLPTQMLGTKVRDDEIESMVADIDIDGSGEVDFEEFMFIMSKRRTVGLVWPWDIGQAAART